MCTRTVHCNLLYILHSCRTNESINFQCIRAHGILMHVCMQPQTQPIERRESYWTANTGIWRWHWHLQRRPKHSINQPDQESKKWIGWRWMYKRYCPVRQTHHRWICPIGDCAISKSRIIFQYESGWSLRWSLWMNIGAIETRFIILFV